MRSSVCSHFVGRDAGLGHGTSGKPGAEGVTHDPMSDLATTIVHAAEGRAQGDPSEAPIELTAFHVSSGDPASVPLSYGRNGNATWIALERALGEIEAAQALAFASGMAAATALLLALTETSGRVIAPRDGYYTLRLLLERLRSTGRGIEPVLVDLQDLDGVRAALTAGPALLWAESPTNPLLRVADLGALARLAAEHGSVMIADNTLATAILQRPLEHGAMASFASLTKAASGHSDVLLGAVATRDRELLARLLIWRTLIGAIPGPVEAWLALRGLRTLALRLERQCANASAIAEFLRAHARVRHVHYPSADDAVARAQMPTGFGPLLSFEIDGDASAADAVIERARVIRPATSFGGIGSTWERRGRWAGESAPPSLIRLSVGIERAGDLIADIQHALTS
jgi:cystathionine gamma-synthase